MDLKDKFSNYQTEVDAEAWAHFQLLRNNRRPKRRFFWWYFWRGLLILGVVSIGIWQGDALKENSTWLNSTEVVEDSNETKTAVTNKNELIPSKTEKITNQLSKENLTEEAVSLEEKGKLISTEQTKSSETSLSVEGQSMSSSKQQNNNASSVQPEAEISVVLQRETSLPETVLSASSVDSSTAESAKDKKQRLAALLASLPISPLATIATVVTIDSIASPKLTKPIRRKRNTVKLSLGYADAFINGFSTANPVNKQGFSAQIEYYHEWNRLIGTGLSAGYVHMIDRANPDFLIKDRETVKFLHANLYLFLVNEKRHKLLAKVGGGLTNTDRTLGTFLIKPNEPVERGFQINNITGFGYTVEGAYEFQLSKALLIGTHFSILTHNEGGRYVGLSVGHSF